MLIGLNGKLQSGKDTTFLMIREIQEGRGKTLPSRISFADPLKHSAAAALGLDFKTLEDLKNREDLCYVLEASPTDTYKFNIRQYLQWYGTEAHRDIFGDNFWVDMALPRTFDHHRGIYVVTDMRFPNELERVKELGGHCVKVVRDVATGHSGHASEQNLDNQIDYFLDNKGTLDDLRSNVEHLLDQLGEDIYMGQLQIPLVE